MNWYWTSGRNLYFYLFVIAGSTIPSRGRYHSCYGVTKTKLITYFYPKLRFLSLFYNPSCSLLSGLGKCLTNSKLKIVFFKTITCIYVYVLHGKQWTNIFNLLIPKHIKLNYFIQLGTKFLQTTLKTQSFLS